ncbi:MAG: hypothetical protein Kow0022_08150 [Phycisphaerales bacterium]
MLPVALWVTARAFADGGSSRDPFSRVDEAMASGDLVRADRLLRVLADDEQHRLRAIQALESLHRMPGFELPVDEAEIERALATVQTRMHRYETAHFVTLSDCDASWTREKSALLERTHHQYFRWIDQIGLDVAPPDHKLLCILFSDYEQYRSFARRVDSVDAPWAGGYFATRANRVVLFDDRHSPAIREAMERLSEHEARIAETRARAQRTSRSGMQAMADALNQAADRLEAEVEANRQRISAHAERMSIAKAVHECVHMLSYNTGLQLQGKVYPFWISEGLATAFETGEPSQPFGPREAYEAREASFDRIAEENRLIPLNRLVSVPAGIAGADELGDPVYAQSYVLFTYLSRTAPDAMKRYLHELNRQPSGYFDPEQQIALFERHFGRIEAVERALLRSRGQSRLTRQASAGE